MAALQVELVAADRKVWTGEARQLLARTTDGELGILPGHAPILGVLVEGEVRITPTDGSVVSADIGGGFLSVDHDRVVVVAESVDIGERPASRPGA
ncbi:MAG TPA: F0F1 ATP synthase subunit epsilon [Actinomycetales bacterium]|nr:F0F1 ATP synthase subunit epsilon [Actinomycetales bacterium]